VTRTPEAIADDLVAADGRLLRPLAVRFAELSLEIEGLFPQINTAGRDLTVLVPAMEQASRAILEWFKVGMLLFDAVGTPPPQ
jgi:hypothetical protein